jgi:hypothetical protein
MFILNKIVMQIAYWFNNQFFSRCFLQEKENWHHKKHKLIVDCHVEYKNNGAIVFDVTIIVPNMNIVLTFDVVLIVVLIYNIKKLLFKLEMLSIFFGLIIKMNSKTNCLKVNLPSIKSVWILFLFVYHCKLLRWIWILVTVLIFCWTILL